ncbi:MAG: 30S ribosomal protein S20 [Ignavibacteria bacterium]|jgi:small subunit ribosomal protein S20|nr:30S ribosomal protein S20 [Ignavibacteria bacterium]
MAHHKSALKRIRQTRTKKLYNRLNKKAMKLAIRNVREATNYEEGMKLLTTATSILDRTAAHGVIHKNYASNRKQALSALVKKLKTA